MAAVSKVINLMTEYGLTDVNALESRCHSLFAKRAVIVGKLNSLQPRIAELNEQISVFRENLKYKDCYKDYKSLSGRKQKKYEKENSYELQRYRETLAKAREWYPDQKMPSVKSLTEQRDKLIAERTAMNTEYSALNSQFKTLTEARKTLSAYLANEREVSQQKRKKQVLE